MASRSGQNGFHQPFADLNKRMRKERHRSGAIARPGSRPARGNGPKKAPGAVPPTTPEEERRLFFEAMAGVVPLDRSRYVDPQPTALRSLPGGSEDPSTDAVVTALTELVASGKGYAVADTPEYIEGTGYGVDPSLPAALHRGRFAIQDHVDLHGLSAREAKAAFDAFLESAVRRGLRGVLVVHGRGLRSPAGPVLKSKVALWLGSGRWRKMVLAWSSARPIDGGAGATYVLLRRRPYRRRRLPDPDGTRG
jgi:DNA-nicking Smr family endonuclease